MHENARLIERLYSAIGDGEPGEAASCYAPDARFRDIAFDLAGRDSIRGMWRLVASRGVRVTFDSLAADDRRGAGRWVARYTFSDTGRPVVNDTRSRFAFRGGLIVAHRDECDAWSWANQAYPLPGNLLVGLIGPLRRFGARRKLEAFLRENPEAPASSPEGLR